MLTRHKSCLLAVIAILLITACTPQTVDAPETTTVPAAATAPDQTAGAPETTEAPATATASFKPLTLHLAIPDGTGVLYEPYVLEFIEQAKTLSNGSITIEPTWEAGDHTSAGYEAGVVQLVKDGMFELGLAASTAFDGHSITSFESLQAPFLIDNDALAKAVATSAVASKMLENLSASGLAGLTLWPEDLYHPFSVDSAKPLLTPQDFAGLTIRATDKGVGEMLIKALGGTPIFEGYDYQGAESGFRHGVHLMGQQPVTGNVTFFTMYQVLFANGAAFKKLSDAQRAVLEQAAAAAQKKALAERPRDVDAGIGWCRDGGTIVLASAEQVAALQTTAQPVFDKLQENSFNAESIAAIRELKAKTQPSAGAQACTSTIAIPTQVSAEKQTWSEGLPPNGVWQVTLTNEDVIKMGVSEVEAPDWSGVYTYTFQDGVFHITWKGTEAWAKGETGSASGNYEVVEDFVRLAQTNDEWVDDVQWRFDQEGLHFHLLATQNDPFTEIRALFEAKPWQKIG